MSGAAIFGYVHVQGIRYLRRYCVDRFVTDNLLGLKSSERSETHKKFWWSFSRHNTCSAIPGFKQVVLQGL